VFFSRVLPGNCLRCIDADAAQFRGGVVGGEGWSELKKPGFALILMMAASSAQAHPHAWIDVRSTIVMSAEGLISAIEEEWLFDDLYSAAVVDGFKNDSPGQAATVRDFAPDVIKNLEPYGYFMRITVDDRPVKLNTVTEYKSEMKGQQLLLSFTAPLAEPVDPKRYAVSFAVYDPTYYIHMAHLAQQPPAIRSKTQTDCAARVEQANPSAEDFARAFSLDQGASPQYDLGHLFAEKVRIQCK